MKVQLFMVSMQLSACKRAIITYLRAIMMIFDAIKGYE